MTEKEEMEVLKKAIPDLQEKYRHSTHALLNLSGPKAKIEDRRAALWAWHEAGLALFNVEEKVIAKYASATPDGDPVNYTDKAETAVNLLDTIAAHYTTLFHEARILNIPADKLKLNMTAFTNLQRMVNEILPGKANALRDRFVQAGLPVSGFETVKSSAQGIDARFFIIGIVLLVSALGLSIWGFILGDLTSDQRRILQWILPLASGFGAGSFTGSIWVKGNRLIPGLATAATGGFAIWLLTLVLLPSASEYQTVSVYLQHRKQPLLRDFELIVFIPGLNPIRERGHDGAASLQLSSHLKIIESLVVKCPGFSLRDRGPFSIARGRLLLVMVENASPAPLLPEQFPSEDAIADRPSKEQLTVPPRFKPTEVTFRYKNLTDRNLRLLLFNCSRHIQPPKGNLVPRSPWMDWEFLARDEFQTFDRFEGSSGWFCFFVYTWTDLLDGRNNFPLGCKNIFERRITMLTVTETGDEARPFRATFEQEE
jgi:hypothetical protein